MDIWQSKLYIHLF